MQYDKSLVIDILHQIIDAIEIVQKRCTYAKVEDDFCDTELGQEKLYIDELLITLKQIRNDLS